MENTGFSVMEEIDRLHGENEQLKEEINKLQNRKITKEESRLLGIVHECKIALKKKNLKKTGKTNKYDYFELSDFLPDLEIILQEHGLASYFEFDDGQGFLTILESETGVFHTWSTPCKSAEVKENSYDVGVHMKASQAVQKYARRTLYLQALDIVESNGLEVDEPEEQSKFFKQKKSKSKYPVKPVREEQSDEVTADRIDEILKAAEKQHFQDNLKKLKEERTLWNWETAKPYVEKLCKSDAEYKACSQSLVFKKAEEVQ